MDPAPEITPVDLTLESAVRPLVQPSIRSFFVKVSEDEHRTLLALQAVREREKEVAENRMIALPLHNNGFFNSSCFCRTWSLLAC